MRTFRRPMRRRPHTCSAPKPLALAAMAIALAVAGCRAAPDTAPLKTGDPAPAYEADRLDRGRFELGELRGNPVLLNVWATWCIPCRTEMPVLQTVHEKYAARGLMVVGVNVDQRHAEDDVRAFLEELGITFPIVRDPDDRVTRTFRLFGVPETFLIDKDGRVAFRWIGRVTLPDVERRVQAVLD